jgi:hypothetical protein
VDGAEGFGAGTSPGIAGALEVRTVGSASWSGLGVACTMCVCLDDPHPILLSIHVCTRLPSVYAVVLRQRIKRELGGNMSNGCPCGERQGANAWSYGDGLKKKKVFIFVFVSFFVENTSLTLL